MCVHVHEMSEAAEVSVKVWYNSRCAICHAVWHTRMCARRSGLMSRDVYISHHGFLKVFPHILNYPGGVRLGQERIQRELLDRFDQSSRMSQPYHLQTRYAYWIYYPTIPLQWFKITWGPAIVTSKPYKTMIGN